MNHNFNLKFNHLQENNPTAKDESTSNDYKSNYPGESNTRNVCFAWNDGRKQFLNYTYLICGEFYPSENKIILNFSTHLICVRGKNLLKLFYEFMGHIPHLISEVNERYVLLENEDFCITKIESTSKE